MNFIGTTIEMFRGDSETLTVKVRDKVTKAQIPLVTGDTVKFTVRRKENDVITFQKTVTAFTDGNALVEVLPADTVGKEPGRYVYDVEITFADGDVKTPAKGTYNLKGDVTYA